MPEVRRHWRVTAKPANIKSAGRVPLCECLAASAPDASRGINRPVSAPSDSATIHRIRKMGLTRFGPAVARPTLRSHRSARWPFAGSNWIEH